jgi:hypothetical protein
MPPERSIYLSINPFKGNHSFNANKTNNSKQYKKVYYSTVSSSIPINDNGLIFNSFDVFQRVLIISNICPGCSPGEGLSPLYVPSGAKKGL